MSKRNRGHYCWACGRIRSNERFSGGGHQRHVCRDCQKLGPEELVYRQGVRDIERCLDFGGGIRRQHRQSIARFLEHSNPRIREYAQRIKAKLDTERQERWKAIAMDNVMAETLWPIGPDGPEFEAASSEL